MTTITRQQLEQAATIVIKHARYHDRVGGGVYAVRWPLGASRATFAADTYELTRKVVEVIANRAIAEREGRA